MTMYGQVKSFQKNRNVKMASVAMAPPETGQDNRPQNAEAAAAIDTGGILQFARNGQEELPQQEDAETAGGRWDDQRGQAVEPVQFPDRDVVGDEQDLVRHDQRRDHDQEEQQVATGKVQSGQGIRGQNVDHDHQTGTHRGYDQAVEERAHQVDTARDRAECWRS